MIFVSVNDFKVGQYQLAQSNDSIALLQSYIDREEKKCIYKILGPTLGDLVINYKQSPPQITSGPLVIGTTYTIKTFVTLDDFTNVGAASNASGVVFKATGTTPTNYSHSSVLLPGIDRYDNIINAFYLQNTTDLHYAWVGRLDEFRNPAFFDSYGLKDVLMNNIYYYYITETSMFHGQSGVVNSKVDTASDSGASNTFRFAEQKWNKAGFDTWLAIRWRCLYYEPAVYPEFTGIPPIVKYGSLF